ncbi:MAPEG family protein [Litorivivens sp.]|uniref:MAPEG family protein n=1 Tax=Litorivivens sp. TaxID=2020868 RepID=UPI0035620565
MNVALICIGLLGLLCIATGFNVTVQRGKAMAMYGFKENPEDPLYKASRAHGNTIEYAPILAVMIFVLAQAPMAEWVMWSMILATFSRYLLVAGLLLPKTMAKPNPMRFVGALGTFIAGGILAVATVTMGL